MNGLDILLENYWIIKDENRELFYQLRDSLNDLKSVVSNKLGYQLVNNSHIIKLEKIPGKPEAWMGIETFEDKMEYGLLCILLMFLEDKAKEEQFLLSELTEYIEGVFSGEDSIDWTLYRHRRYLIKVLRFAFDMGMIKVNDGDEQSFSSSTEGEVLYESTGLSKYFIRNFTGNILEYNSLKDLEDDEWLGIDRDKGPIRRNRVYRRIIMSPAVYSEGVEDPDYLYIKNYRNMIQNDMEEYLSSDFHVHKNGAFLILNPDKNYKRSFPENKTISDIALQVNSIIRGKIENETIKLREDDIIILPVHLFENIIEEVKEEYAPGWSKEYREMRLEKLYVEIIQYMKSFSFIEWEEGSNEIRIMPLTGKIMGKYPDRFKEISEGDETNE